MSLWMKSYGVAIQMKATEQYFPVVLFIMLYKVVLTFESVDEIQKCSHPNESYLAVLLLWYSGSFCCARWFLLLSLWMKFQNVLIRMKAI